MRIQNHPNQRPQVSQRGQQGLPPSQEPVEKFESSKADQELAGRRVVSALVWGMRGTLIGGVALGVLGAVALESTAAAFVGTIVGSLAGMYGGVAYGASHPNGKTVDKVIRGDFEPGWGSFRGPGSGWTIGG